MWVKTQAALLAVQLGLWGSVCLQSSLGSRCHYPSISSPHSHGCGAARAEIQVVNKEKTPQGESSTIT